MYKKKPNLEIETNEKTDEDLDWLIANEDPTPDGEPLNKSTICNRAIQLYAELLRTRKRGEPIRIGRTGRELTWE